MAKLTGIDPKAGRKTLGQAMKELIDDGKVDADSQAAFEANHGESAKNSQIAKGIMARNTYQQKTD